MKTKAELVAAGDRELNNLDVCLECLKYNGFL